MSTRAHWNNKKMLLSLIVIASHLNPLGKLGNKIRYLTLEEQNYVINNIQPEGIDTSELTKSIKNFKRNELTLEFIHGLFDGDGNISIYFVKPSEAKGLNRASSENEPLEEIKAQHDNKDNEVKEIKLYVGYSFTIVQDKHNLSLLKEIKSFFNETGGIYEINDNCNLYKISGVIEKKKIGNKIKYLIPEALANTGAEQFFKYIFAVRGFEVQL